MSIEYMSAVMDAGKNLELTDKEYMVFLVLADYANGDGTCWPGRKSIGAKANGAAPGTVSNAVAKFEKMGYVSRSLNSAPFDGETNLYQIHLDAIKERITKDVKHSGVHQPVKGGSPASEGGVHQPVNQTINRTTSEPDIDTPLDGRQAKQLLTLDGMMYFEPDFYAKVQNMIEVFGEDSVKEAITKTGQAHRKKISTKSRGITGPAAYMSSILAQIQDESEDKTKQTSSGNGTWYGPNITENKHTWGWAKVDGDTLHFRFKEGGEWTTTHVPWVQAAKDGKLTGNHLGMFHTRMRDEQVKAKVGGNGAYSY